MTEPNKLALAGDADPRLAVAPRNVSQVAKFAQDAAAARICGVSSPEEAMIRMATGMELGLSCMQSLRGVHVIKGRPTIAADMQMGVCLKNRDICKKFVCLSTSATEATFLAQRVDEEPQKLTYTIEDARRAGLTERDIWKAHPAAMLRARAITALARVVFPDLLNGLYSPDEVEDIPTPSVPAKTYKAEPKDPVAAKEQVKDPVVDVPDAEIVTDAPAENVALLVRVQDAKTLQELNMVAKDIKAATMADADRAYLRAEYKLRKEQIDAEETARNESEKR